MRLGSGEHIGQKADLSLIQMSEIRDCWKPTSQNAVWRKFDFIETLSPRFDRPLPILEDKRVLEKRLSISPANGALICPRALLGVP
jgi:hypothetical protein